MVVAAHLTGLRNDIFNSDALQRVNARDTQRTATAAAKNKHCSSARTGHGWAVCVVRDSGTTATALSPCHGADELKYGTKLTE